MPSFLARAEGSSSVLLVAIIVDVTALVVVFVVKNEPSQHRLLKQIDDEASHGEPVVVTLEDGHDFAEEVGLSEPWRFLGFDAGERKHTISASTISEHVNVCG